MARQLSLKDNEVMNNTDDDLGNLPPMVPDKDDVDSHISNRRGQNNDIVRPGYYAEKVKVSTWPVRIMLLLLTCAAGAGGYAGYYFYGESKTDLRRAELRISDLETRLALAGESSDETDNTLMQNIEKTIEQYDLLWANWRSNNRTFDEFKGEVARLKLINEGQDETTANNSLLLATASQKVTSTQASINSLTTDYNQLNQSVATMNSNIEDLAALRGDIEAIRGSLNSGDSTVLGLVGRLEYIEVGMESVNAHRLQVNESLFRLQESIEALQRSISLTGQ
jgi:chromosome segregation ATPase